MWHLTVWDWQNCGPWVPDRIGICKCWILRRGENLNTWRKISWSKDENQQQIQPTYDTGAGSQTRATLVGGERSHHCAIPAPLIFMNKTLFDARNVGNCISEVLNLNFFLGGGDHALPPPPSLKGLSRRLFSYYSLCHIASCRLRRLLGYFRNPCILTFKITSICM